MVVSSMQHHPHHSQGPAPPQHLQHTRPSSIVHPPHHQAPPQQSQHPSAYSSTHSIQPAYQQTGHVPAAQQAQELPYYAHQSAYSTPGTTSGYTSAGKFPQSRRARLVFGGQCVSLYAARHLRHDGRSPDKPKPLPSDAALYASIQLSSFYRVAIWSRPAPKCLPTDITTSAPIDVLWRATTSISVSTTADSLPVPVARSAIASVYGVAAEHDDVSYGTAAPDDPAREPTRATRYDGKPATHQDGTSDVLATPATYARAVGNISTAPEWWSVDNSYRFIDAWS